jgi:hypothetical protein
MRVFDVVLVSAPAGSYGSLIITLSQQWNNALHRDFGFDAQRVIAVVGDRVTDHGKWISGQPVEPGYNLSASLEAVRYDCDSGNSEPLGFNGVVQTARRATPSVADGGEYGVSAAH